MLGGREKKAEMGGERAEREGEDLNKRWSSSGFYPVFMPTALGLTGSVSFI